MRDAYFVSDPIHRRVSPSSAINIAESINVHSYPGPFGIVRVAYLISRAITIEPLYPAGSMVVEPQLVWFETTSSWGWPRFPASCRHISSPPIIHISAPAIVRTIINAAWIDCGCRVVVLALSDHSARILLYYRVIVRRKILAYVLNSAQALVMCIMGTAALFLVSKKHFSVPASFSVLTLCTPSISIPIGQVTAG